MQFKLYITLLAVCFVGIFAQAQAIICTMSTFLSFGQEFNSDNLIGKWRLNWVESGFFPSKDLLFERTNQELTDYIFEFKKDGTVIHQNEKNVECPVGMFTVKYGTWKSQNDLVTIELRGEIIADSFYWWIIEYKADIQKDKMYLKVKEIIKNKQIEPTKTWNDLINEKR